MKAAARQSIAASENDLKNNRLGLMSAGQQSALSAEIDGFSSRSAKAIRQVIGVAALLTIGLVLLTFARVMIFPLALVVEVIIVAVMVSLTSSLNRFAQQLALDREAEAVRIIKGRAAGYALRAHPFWHSLRVELETYKLLDASMLRQFVGGELYQFYVLPHSGVIIAAELIAEKGFRHLH